MEYSDGQSPQESYHHPAAPLPPFDKALGTRRWCIVGLIFCYILSIGLICIGSAFLGLTGYATGYCGEGLKTVYWEVIGLSKASVEVWLLAFNLLVTLATECAGYIHATSLRWALYREGRLRHNSNLRLFTSSKRSMPNRWFVNAFWFLSITVSYSCASQLVITGSPSGGYSDTRPWAVAISSLSLVILGCCLFLLSLLATWTLVPTYSSHIATWNSDPLNTALAMQHGRSQKAEASTSANARLQQSSMTNTSRGIRYMLIFLWLLVPLLFVASMVTWNFTGQQDMSFISDWFDTSAADMGSHWPLYLINGKNDSCSELVSPRTVAVNILFVAALQLLYTVALM